MVTGEVLTRHSCVQTDRLSLGRSFPTGTQLLTILAEMQNHLVIKCLFFILTLKKPENVHLDRSKPGPKPGGIFGRGKLVATCSCTQARIYNGASGPSARGPLSSGTPYSFQKKLKFCWNSLHPCLTSFANASTQSRLFNLSVISINQSIVFRKSL